MSRNLSTLLTHLAVELETEQATLPWPTTAADGAAISTWASGSFTPEEAWIKVANVDDAEVTLSDIVLAVHFGDGATDWASAGLVTPDAVTIAAGSFAFLKVPTGAAALGDRWALVATVAGGATPLLTVTAIPLEVHGR
jgi:hypothetical protein